MKITFSFEGDVAGAISLSVESPTRLTFARMATALWRSYRTLQEAKGTPPDPCAIMLTGMGPNKIEAIRAVRIVTNMSLQEARELVENIGPGRSQIIRVATPEARHAAVITLQAGGLTVVEPLQP